MMQDSSVGEYTSLLNISKIIVTFILQTTVTMMTIVNTLLHPLTS